MRVKEIMTPDPRLATPTTTLAEAAALMLDGDCGILPVVENGDLIGVVTDRDMYIALATRDRRASELTVAEVAQSPVRICDADEEIQSALQTMSRFRIRRLPVRGIGGAVVGVVSIDDILLNAGALKTLSRTEPLRTLQAICAQHRPLPYVVDL
jgi:CBS domain-containing protein